MRATWMVQHETLPETIINNVLNALRLLRGDWNDMRRFTLNAEGIRKSWWALAGALGILTVLGLFNMLLTLSFRPMGLVVDLLGATVAWGLSVLAIRLLLPRIELGKFVLPATLAFNWVSLATLIVAAPFLLLLDTGWLGNGFGLLLSVTLILGTAFFMAQAMKAATRSTLMVGGLIAIMDRGIQLVVTAIL